LQSRHVHVHRRLSLLADWLCLGDCLRAVPDRPRGDGHPCPTTTELGSMTRRLLMQSVVIHIALLAMAVVTIYPVLWMVFASVMPARAAQSLPPPFWPRHPTLVHYAELFERLNLARYFANSLLIAVSVSGLSLVINSMAGYALAKLRFA